jgi:hypothetical protein
MQKKYFLFLQFYSSKEYAMIIIAEHPISLRQLWPTLFEFIKIYQNPIFIQYSTVFADTENIDRLGRTMQISGKITKKMCKNT